VRGVTIEIDINHDSELKPAEKTHIHGAEAIVVGLAGVPGIKVRMALQNLTE
jgi:hypothetical protein